VAQSSIFNTYHLGNSLTWTRGGHNLRFGFDGRRYISTISGLAGARGNYGYSSLERFLLDLPPNVVAERTFGNNSIVGNQWLLFGYIQDNWNIRSKVNLSLGLRYQYVTIPEELKQQQFNSVADVPGVISFTQPQTQKRNFAPNVGIAFSPTTLTVIRAGFGMSYDAIYGTPYTGVVSPFSSTMAMGNLNSNAPGFLAGGGLQNNFIDNGQLTESHARARISSYFPKQRLPYAMQWNAAFQQGIWRKFTIELKYLGSRGVHLPVFSNLNAANRVTAANGLPLFYSQPTTAQLNALTNNLTAIQALPGGPLTQYGFTNPVYSMMPDGNSWYHAGVVQLSHTFTGGFQFLGNYTWSHLIDDSTGTMMDLGMGGQRVRANSIYDRRHRATVTGLWDVAGLFRDTDSIARNIFANVSLSGTFTYESPQYLTAMSGVDAGLMGTTLGTGVITNPNGTSMTSSGVTPLSNSFGQTVGYLANNPNAQFIRSAPGLYTPLARNNVRFGQTNNFDVAVTKGFSWRDRFNFEVRGEAYNLFNHPQYTWNQIRNIDFLNTTGIQNYLIPGNAEFGNVQGTFPSNPRTLQVALRASW
jgi:hypothetical protein